MAHAVLMERGQEDRVSPVSWKYPDENFRVDRTVESPFICNTGAHRLMLHMYLCS